MCTLAWPDRQIPGAQLPPMSAHIASSRLPSMLSPAVCAADMSTMQRYHNVHSIFFCLTARVGKAIGACSSSEPHMAGLGAGKRRHWWARREDPLREDLGSFRCRMLLGLDCPIRRFPRMFRPECSMARWRQYCLYAQNAVGGCRGGAGRAGSQQQSDCGGDVAIAEECSSWPSTRRTQDA